MKHEVTNLTLSEATAHAPYLTYARCIDASNRPAQHVGDWPVEGEVYPVRFVKSLVEGVENVHVLGFEGAYPYFNAYGIHRFEVVTQLWLN